MRTLFQRIRPVHILSVIVIFWIVLVTALAYQQYHLFLYDALDLGIYTQVLWNTLRGDWFAYTFNHYSYLADHREWILLFFVPLFALFQHPLTLVALQAAAVLSSVWPLSGIVRHVFRGHKHVEWYVCVWAFIFLFHPSIQSMVLYEFHALVFVISTMAWMWYAFVRERQGMVWFFALLSLAIREEVGLTIAMSAVVMAIMARTTRMRVHTALIGCVSVLVSVVMIRLGGVWFPQGTEKFFVFYPQLGASMIDIAHRIIMEPLHALYPLWSFDHPWILVIFSAAVGFTLCAAPIFFLPLLPQYVILALIPESMLMSAVQTHYAAPFVVWGSIGSIYGMRWLMSRMPARVAWYGVTIMVLIAVFTSLLFSGFLFAASRIAASDRDNQAMWAAVETIPRSAIVMTSHTFAAAVSTRESVFPLLHVCTGRDHYAETTYRIPKDIDILIFSEQDIIEMLMNFSVKDTRNCLERIHDVIEDNALVRSAYTPDVVMYTRQDNGRTRVVEDHVQGQGKMFHGLELYPCQLDGESAYIECSMRVHKPEDSLHVHAIIQWMDENNRVIFAQPMVLAHASMMPLHRMEAGTLYTHSAPISGPVQAHHVQVRYIVVAQLPQKVLLSRSGADISQFESVSVDVTE